jgi:hypothetical protein
MHTKTEDTFMQIHALDGTVLEISSEEAHRIHDEVSKMRPVAVSERHVNSHHFRVGDRQVAMTQHEMKTVADTWWEKYGKSSMEHYFTEMKAKAAENIRAAVNCTHELTDESEIKNALAYALAVGDADVIAEVIHEAAEWVNADSGLRSISRS